MNSKFKRQRIKDLLMINNMRIFEKKLWRWDQKMSSLKQLSIDWNFKTINFNQQLMLLSKRLLLYNQFFNNKKINLLKLKRNSEELNLIYNLLKNPTKSCNKNTNSYQMTWLKDLMTYIKLKEREQSLKENSTTSDH